MEFFGIDISFDRLFNTFGDNGVLILIDWMVASFYLVMVFVIGLLLVYGSAESSNRIIGFYFGIF